MWKQQKPTNLFSGFFLIFVFMAHFLAMTRALSDKRLCADLNCKEIISLGTGKISYRAGEEGMVSFKINAPIRIKSKSAGSDPSLWGIEVYGREGYAPKKYIMEKKILVGENDLKYIVDVNPVNSVPTLTASEKLVGQENTLEKVTTAPLNFVPTNSTENPLKNSSDEKLDVESTPAATPVITEVVDGTEIPIFTNDEDATAKTTNNDVEPLNINENIPKTDNDVENVHDEEDNENQENTISQDDTEKGSDIKNMSHTSKDINLNIESHDVKLEEVKTISPKQDTQIESKQNTSVEREHFEKVEEPKKSIEGVSDLIEKHEGIETKEESPSNAALEKISKNQNANHTIESEQLHSKASEQNAIEMGEKNKEEELEKHQTNEEQKVSINNISSYLTATISSDFDLKTQTNTATNSVEQQEVNDKKDMEQQIVSKKINVETDSAKSYEDNEDNLLREETAKAQISSNTDDLVNAFSGVTETSNFDLNPTTAMPEKLHEGKNSSETEIHNEVLSDNVEQIAKDNKNNNNDINVENIGSMSDITSTNPPSTLNDNNSDNSNKEPIVQNDEIKEAIPYQQFESDKQKEYNNINSFSSTEEPIKEKIIDDLVENSNLNKNLETPNNIEYQEEIINSTENNLLQEKEHRKEDLALEDIKPTIYTPSGDAPLNTPPPITYQESPTTATPSNGNYAQDPKGSEEQLSSFNDPKTTSYNSISTLRTETVSPPLQKESEQPKTLPSPIPPTPPTSDNSEVKENKGLFATIMGTVNNMLSINKKNKQSDYNGKNHEHQELDDILMLHGKNKYNVEETKENIQYCRNIGPNGDCPEIENHHEHIEEHFHYKATNSILNSDLNLDTFLRMLASNILENSNLLAFLVIVAASSLFFIFGYYCFCNSSREGALLLKLNQLESSLLASHKENAILKHNLMSTRQKLASIEDNSFGSNDMVVSLRKELEEELNEKARLQEQISVLQKELENAADAGIELNKIVSELLSNQTGDESIISSVEELQKQLNEQQNTIYEINASLAEKSRENSELQLLIAEQNARYEAELANVQRDNDELDHEKGNLVTKIEEMKNDFDKDMTAALEGKNLEIKRLQNEILDLTSKLENEHIKWQTSIAKIEALEECLKNVRKDPNVNIAEVINVANVKAQLIETQNKYTFLKERLETELDSRKLAENQLEIVSAEVAKLKQDFNQSEKDKLEAQTRLEVLSNYFKDKENQLQKELNLKEAMWLKQQGETTTTVDRVTAMQEEIQSLKSQNDSLRAEIEAQVAAHKAQTGTLENRAHETWLAARQSDRRYEEARAEATALRRQLTALAGGNSNEANKPTSTVLGDELTQAPSPIHMESPGSPMLGRMPPPPFLPPPFMGPPPPFMGMPPPPPFVPPGEMRPAPLGRIMSPPPQRLDYEDYLDLDYDKYMDYSRNNTWQRHTYSPPPRTYRSLSPTDSRYNYGTERDLLSTYDTETDFSPPPSPRESRRRSGNSSERIDSNTKMSYGNTKRFNTSNKGLLSSGSEKSFNTPSHNDTKTRKGNANHGGKTIV